MFQNAGGRQEFGGGGFGGGFSAGGFSSPGNSAAAGDRQKKFRSVNVVPITANNVHEMAFDDSTFRLGEIEISQITIVGTVVNFEKSHTCNTYKVDDTTGVVTVKHWNSSEDEDDGMEQAQFEEGTYVRIHAQLRSFQKTITLNVLHIRAVEDLNEITTHMLECIKFKLVSEKKNKKPAPTFNNYNQSYDGGNANAVTHGMDAIQTKVYNLIEGCEAQEGMSISTIQSQLKGLNAGQVKKALDFLSNEGHIYSTINDEHFRSTS